MNKGWIIGCAIAAILGIALYAGLGALFFGGIFTLTKPVVDSSEEFLGLLGQGKVAEAYASTSSGFRAQQDEASFAKAVKDLGLTDYSSASWGNRSIKNSEGLTEGTVTSKSGGTSPVSIQLVKEGDKWKIVGVRYAGVDLTTIKAPLPIPSEAELRSMAKEALLDFNQAVKARDFSAFFAKISDSWKKQTTPGELANAFQEFSDKKIDIGSIAALTPLFDSPASTNEKGFLVLIGHYPTKPSVVRFTLKYIHETAGWKLIAIEVNVGKE